MAFSFPDRLFWLALFHYFSSTALETWLIIPEDHRESTTSRRPEINTFARSRDCKLGVHAYNIPELYQAGNLTTSPGHKFGIRALIEQSLGEIPAPPSTIADTMLPSHLPHSFNIHK